MSTIKVDNLLDALPTDLVEKVFTIEIERLKEKLKKAEEARHQEWVLSQKRWDILAFYFEVMEDLNFTHNLRDYQDTREDMVELVGENTTRIIYEEE